jgi:hypothetical protein
MIDLDGVHRSGTVLPGKMRLEEEERLKRMMVENLTTY